MKKIILLATAAAIFSSGLAHAEGLKKEITIVATINDAIFVSKPDGSSWYDKEELFAKDYTQTEFSSKNLPVRIYSSVKEVNVSLVQPLTIIRGDGAQLLGVTINFAGQPIVMGTPAKVMQTNVATGGFDNTYTRDQ